MGAPVIEVRELSKAFGTTVALDGLDLAVQPGEVCGFLGPNGAGKTTTIRVLLGLIRADQGSARVLAWTRGAMPCGCTARSPTCRATSRCGRPCPAARSLDLLARMHGAVDRAAPGPARRAVPARPDDEGARLLEGQPAEGGAGRGAVDRRRAAPPRRADRGPRPADGGRLPRRGGELRDRGATVLLASHVLGEVERLCDTVTIIRDGRVVEVRQPRGAAPPHQLDRHAPHPRRPPATGRARLCRSRSRGTRPARQR